MKISSILDHIDNGHIVLPEFQRGYVWNRDQVRGLYESLYRHHPVGGLLVWTTNSYDVNHRGSGPLATGIIKLLLDGQQRMTTIYGVTRGQPPKFFDGNTRVFTGLCFHLDDEIFRFYQPIRMADDPLWVDVSKIMSEGLNDGIGNYIELLSTLPEHNSKVGEYAGRLTRLFSIIDIDLHIEEVTGEDKTLDVVVNIFNRVNSGGTKLSKGDLALAKICATWPSARNNMKAQLNDWRKSGYAFNLDWYLRSINTVLTGEANFSYLHNKGVEEIRDGLTRATKVINNALNMINGRVGLDHDRVLFGRFAIPVMANYLDRRNETLSQRERDKLLFWYIQAGMWGRFSGSTESYIDQDLAVIEDLNGALDRLLEQLRLWHGGLKVESAHFLGWSLGARFYPVLYMLTRMGEAKDWGTGLALKAGMLGNLNSLEVHHIFPKSQLYRRNYQRAEVNALANFCFLTKDTNLQISNRLPEKYFLEIEEKHPGALESQWIPTDSTLWKIENYSEFLKARRILLAKETNRVLAELLHDDHRWKQMVIVTEDDEELPVAPPDILGGITSEEEEQELDSLNSWVIKHGLQGGVLDYDFADAESGEQKAVFDLAWPNGIQQELSQPVAVLLNEETEVLALASGAGFRCFTNSLNFKQYVKNEILTQAERI